MSQANESEPVLTAWKNINKQLINNAENAENAETNLGEVHHSEALEKLGLGLHLLRAAKMLASNVVIASLQAENTAKDCIKAIQMLAEQAALKDCYELQDACLLIEDTLYELPENEFVVVKADLFAAINDWSLSSPPELTTIEHSETLAEPTTFNNANALSYAEHIATIERIANEAHDAGYASLYDTSLLIIEALHELSQAASSIKSDLPSLLDNWSALVDAYKQHSLAAIGGIITILRHPDLNILFEDEDFATFASLLAEDLATKKQPELSAHIVVADIPDEPIVPPATLANELDEPVVSSTVAINEVVEPAVQATAVINEIVEEDNEPTPALSPMTQELVELLDTEAGLLNYRFLAVSFEESLDARKEHLQQASEELERMINAAKMVGFEALALLCEQVNANVLLFAQQIEHFSLENRELLTNWVSEVKAYLLVFSKKTGGKKLLAQMTQSSWPHPLSVEASAALLPQMQVKGLGEEITEESNREKVATDDDVSLVLPDDVNKELLELLLQELPSYTQQFSEAIQRLQSGAGSSKDIDVAQRIAHTIKGSANTVGIKGIAVLTHQIEDILMACAKVHKQPRRALTNTLINASDCLEAMCESLLGQGEAPHDAKEILQEVLDWANQIDKKGIQDDDETPVKSAVAADTKAENLESSTKDTAPAPKETKTETTESAQTVMVRVPTEQIENLFRLSGESIILNGQVYERQRRLKNQLQAMEAQFALLQQLGAELEQLIDLKDLSGRTSINVGKDFDALEMDQYNELHTASRRMVEASVDAREISVDMKKELEHMNEVLEYQQRLVVNTQEAVMQTRFVPVGSIVLRLQRGLRQTCRLTNKQGELTLLGENLLIDGDTLNALVEPIMHLLRNAIDHGLETEEERIKLGKPLIGQIIIEFDREGNSILVRVRDDGRGLNFASIRQTAEQRGDLRAGEAISEEELKRLILRPNFSTRTQATQTSGRGVGMDVVNSLVLSLGGSLSLHSVIKQGLTVELRVPLPLSRSHALLAYAGPYKVAISSKGITQVLYSEASEIKIISNEQILVIDDDVYPVVKLEDLLHVEDRRKGKRAHGALLLVQNENKMTAVLVSAITDSREVVIKNFGYYMRKIHGFVGATILGDGSVTPVLDIPELLRAPASARVGVHTASSEVTEASAGLPRILVVDDSLSQRRALEQILTDAGFHVHAARDGIEAAEWLAHSKPDVVVTDLEMPRMNGIELASHIRTQASIKTLPIVMITSRSTQKHRQMAEEVGIDFYLVKPVQDDDLLTKIQSLIDKQRTAVAA